MNAATTAETMSIPLGQYCAIVRAQPPALTLAERSALARLADQGSAAVHENNRRALARLIDPIDTVSADWGEMLSRAARNLLLAETFRQDRACWGWDQQTWTRFVLEATGGNRRRRQAHLVAVGYLLAGHTRLHHAVGIPKLYYDRMLADAPQLLARNVNHWFTTRPARKLIRTLASSEWVRQHQNVLLLGPTDPVTFCIPSLHH